MSIIEKIRVSAKELKTVRGLTACAMLIAISVALDFVADFQITKELQIGVGFIAIAMTGCLLGPVPAMAAGAITDIICVLVNPRGAYFPGFTLSSIAGGFIYGSVLYNEAPSFLRALLAKGIINIVINMGLNTLWLYMMYGNSVAAMVFTRTLKNAVMLVPEALLIVLCAKIIQRIRGQVMIRERNAVR